MNFFEKFFSSQTSGEVIDTENINYCQFLHRIFRIILIVCPIGGVIFLLANFPSILPAIFFGFGISSSSYFLMGGDTSESTFEASLPTIAKIKFAGNLAAIMGCIVLLNFIIEKQTSINFNPAIEDWVALDKSGKKPVRLDVQTNLLTKRPIREASLDIFKEKDHLNIEEDSNFKGRIRIVTDEGFYLGILSENEDFNSHNFYHINDQKILTTLAKKEKDHPILRKIRSDCLDGVGVCKYPELNVLLNVPRERINKGEAHACDRDLVGLRLIIFEDKNGEPGGSSIPVRVTYKAPCNQKELIQISRENAEELFQERWMDINNGIATIIPYGLSPERP